MEASFSLTDDITLLAGANNSGKTSLIELLEDILCTGRASFSISDIPVTLSKEWIDRAYPIFNAHFVKNQDKDSTVQAILNDFFPEGTLDEEQGVFVPPTRVRLRIDYELTDDIRNYSDYMMDLDPTQYSIYFEYSFEVNLTTFKEALEKEYDKLKSRYDRIDDRDGDTEKVRFFKEKMLSTYVSSVIERCYYTDSQFLNRNELETKQFRKLFNFKKIIAGRPLDDQNSGKSKSISRNVIDLACYDDSWKELLNVLPDKILQPIEQIGITEIFRKTSVEVLSEAMSEIGQANGGNTGSMVLNLDISEEAISSLIHQITNTKYQLEGHFLSEASQGLGYSNMIFILLQLENYKRNIDPLLINIFIIEEPESHMHPQMQNVFGKFLRNYYQQKKIQGIVTTHSSEMVRVTDMKNLRVARPTSSLHSKIFDFSAFRESISGDPVLDNFYDWFYEIGFSDIVFADRVIIYEGDTERLLIKKLSTLPEFQSLNQLYIAFVQVGGAYAHNYRKLIEFLMIKTLILTDLDYSKSANTEELVKSSNTTNTTINNFYSLMIPGTTPTIADLYKWKSDQSNILFNGCAYLNYQGESDNFARTLEEAMLAKHYQITTFVEKDRDDWLELRTRDNLKYTVPQKAGKYTLREIVQHTSNGKTDFMYSVILNDLTQNMLPHYIEEGLEWLMK